MSGAWNEFRLGDENVDEDDADQGYWPPALNHNTYNTGMCRTEEDVRALETYRPAPYSNTQPVIAFPDYIDTAMPDAVHPQDGPDLQYLQSFFDHGEGGEYSTLAQATSSWQLGRAAPTGESNNLYVEVFPERPPVNMYDFVTLMVDVNHSNIDPQPLGTTANLSHLGPLVPNQSVRQTSSVDQELSVHDAGLRFAGLAFGSEPQIHGFPLAAQDRSVVEPSAPVLAHAFTAPVDGDHGRAMCDEGQQAPDIEAQAFEADINQKDPLVCEICEILSRDRPAARKHRDTHDPKKVNRYPCLVPGCGKTYRYPKDLAQHTHGEPVLFPCKECSKVFKNRYDNLLKHMYAKHPESPATIQIKKAAANKLPRLAQPSSSSGKTPKKTTKRVSKAGAAKRSSKSKGTQSPLSGESSMGPVLQHQQPRPTNEWDQMLDDMPASPSFDVSVLTPDASGPTFNFSDAGFCPGPGSFDPAP